MQRFFLFSGQPYPYYYHRDNLSKVAVILFLLAFAFIYFFQPFNVVVSEHKMHYSWINLLHSGAAAIIFFLYFSVINNFKVSEDNWTISKEILSLSLVLILIGIANFLIRDVVYNNPNNWSVGYLLEEVRNTFLIGLLLILILVPLNFMREFQKNHKSATLWVPPVVQHQATSENTLQIITKVKGDDFILKAEELLFARAEGNYVEFQLEGNRKELKRLTIKELEDQFKKYPWIIKTHRSYIVNSKKISTISGNAQGYKLKIHHHSSTIPVARSMISSFDTAMERAAL